MAQITLEGLTKDFGRVIAVNNLSLNCPDGEFLSILGPSGCGKTTTLRMIAGLETATKGSIRFDNKAVTDLTPRDRNIAMVFENYALYPHKTVYRNISYPLELRGMSKPDIDKKVKEAAQLLEIHDLLERFPKEISGGQKQRVAIARALVREPAAFAMDEPLSHLDAKLRAYMRAELKHLQKELGTTTVFVTHDQLEAMTMADKIAVMNLGILQQHGTPQELFAEPTNVFVATFIGEPAMNLLTCQMQDAGTDSFIQGTGWKFKLPAQLRARAREQSTGTDLLLGARPQHVLLHKKGELESNGHNLVPGTVYVAEPLGGEQLVRVKVGEQIVQILTVDTLKVDMNEAVELEIPTDRFLLFDKATGKRIK